MNSKYLIAIAATLFVMVFLFSQDKTENNSKNGTNVSEAAKVKKIIQPPAGSSSVVSSDVKSAVGSVPTAETRQTSELVLKQFASHLKTMTKCLGLTGPQTINEKAEPSLENLTANLRASLGDVVVQMDDWSQTEILDQASVRKRVRVDYDYPDGATPSRRLSMYQINSYGMPEIMNLTEDEVNNPNEAYISSLTEGYKVLAEEKGARAYYSDGEELIFSVRNGQLQSVSINKGDRSFNCFNLDQENSSCTCP